MKYCDSIFTTKRWKTREVMVGNIGVGGDHPIRIQSMTTSNTRDAKATIDQIMRLADAGCEIVRVTVQGIKEADTCELIKNGLLQRGYSTPLVADIHFFPPAAMRVIDFVDKVRINPGNYADKRASFKIIDYDDLSYAKELDKIEEKFAPLVEKCKRLKRAMRIGVNHGSLSDRIMNRYGDTPRGMLESALEFAKICRKYDYHDFFFSMKSSNPQVMIHAYRILVAEMIQLGWNYPLHLGVTEAGEGEDGRIKSSMGIGSLLLDGIGDTIRVSLTEDPWLEIDPCRRLVKLAETYRGKGVDPFIESHRNIAEIKRRPVVLPRNISLHRDGTVIAKISDDQLRSTDLFLKLGLDEQFGRPKLKISSVDCILLEELPRNDIGLKKISLLQEIGVGIITTSQLQGATFLQTLKQASESHYLNAKVNRFSLNNTSSQAPTVALNVQNEPEAAWEIIEILKPSLIFLAPIDNRLHYCRRFFEWLQSRKISIPVIFNFQYHLNQDDLVIEAAAECGSLFCDGFGDGVCLEASHDIDFMRKLSFNILQAARLRISKTDFISCPSCGRTLFDLQDVTKRIRARTEHLPGVKIAIMGCIVNGPGEMADADFGYVGSKPGKIDLYVGKKCLERDINFADADDRLIELIKANGRWVEPE